jgi:sterol desaturase/sphingolipid hydroxylase (fatty acid hydroxylase superfamily)/rhodanese-related sulfurtransferase
MAILLMAVAAIAVVKLLPDQKGFEESVANLRSEFPQVPFIRTGELATWMADSKRIPPVILDVRSPAEYEVSHLPGAQHINDALRGRDVIARLDTNRPAVLYCTIGYRSARLAGQLMVLGYTNLHVLEGSIFGWANEDRPLEAHGHPATQVHPYSASYARMLKPEYRARIGRVTMMMDQVPVLQQARMIGALVLMALFLAWESISPAYAWFRNGQRDRTVHGLRNFALGALNTIVITLLFARGWLAAAKWAELHQFGLLHWLGLPMAVHAMFAILLLDSWAYAWHRLNHAVPFFWRYHRLHHTELKMDVTSASRFHVGEIVFSSLLRFPLILLLGIEFWELMVYEAAMFAVVQFHHADIRITPAIDRWLQWIIVTPDMHRVHHSLDPVETNHNYSSLLSIWDRLFETWETHPDTRKLQLGIAGFGAPEQHSFTGMLGTPLRAEEPPPKI